MLRKSQASHENPLEGCPLFLVARLNARAAGNTESLAHQGKAQGERVIWHVNEFDPIHVGNFRGARFRIDFPVIDGFDAVGAESLHARGAWHGSACNNEGFASFEEAAQVDFGVQHVFAAFFAGIPKVLRRRETGEESVVGSPNDAVVLVEGCGSHFSEGVFTAEGCYMG